MGDAEAILGQLNRSMYDSVNAQNVRSPVIQYKPDNLLKWTSSSRAEPVAGYVFTTEKDSPPIRGYYVPASIRSGTQVLNVDLADFQPTSSRPGWYIKPGSTTPIRAIDGILISTKTPVQYVPEHVLLERPLPDTADNQYFFSPTYCVGPQPRKDGPGNLPLQINYVPATPIGNGGTNRASVSRLIEDLPARVREELRLRGQCSNEWFLNRDTNDISGFNWGVAFDASWMLLQVFGAALGIFFTNRAFGRWFT